MAANDQGAGTVTGASLTIIDDDTAGFDVSPSTSTSSRLRTTESGGQASFTVKLATRPTGTVALGVASSNTAEGTVSASSLTFTATTWSTAQTVTLTGVDDAPANADGNQDYTVTLTVNTTSTLDTTYDGLSAVMVYAVNADNEYGLALVPTNGVTGQATEDGGTATFTVALRTQPSAAVTVTVSSLDTSEGTASPSSLTFTTTDWGTARTVTVTGADDDWDDGTVTWAVRLDTSSGGDANYDGLDDEDVSVTTIDNDDAPTATLVLTPSTIDEGGTADTVATVTATLNRASSEPTTITVSAAPVAPAVAGDFTLSAANTLTIAAGMIAEHRHGDDHSERQRRGRGGQDGDRFGDGGGPGGGSVRHDADHQGRRREGVRVRPGGVHRSDGGRRGRRIHGEADLEADGRCGPWWSPLRTTPSFRSLPQA